ncbi:deoxyribonuclease IV [Halalkalibacter alkaliphilus]|uniref:Deoxyribonuclease IV n=1 Tax=Halalkalibacter alkaliphilus TaxID=2917993 RepID=A0A9X2CUY1_9BACI|nr:deoxyribonuclease IV [Halalkalibacter alkaliphilus]MCL7748722.1 deoxyribonuclease IV [Halalkalibacter alkaliphilus]
MYFGSHVSIRNGYYSAAKTAHSLGATAFQFFPKNPRSITVKDFDKDDAQQCATFCSKHNIKSIIHTPYPTKLIPEDQELEQQIILSLINDLEIAEACGSIGVVVHFGTTKTLPPLEGYKKKIDILNQVLSQFSGDAQLLIENNAGAGSDMGITLEELSQVRKLTDYPEKIGFCFDTCHAYASGIWNGDNWKELEEKAIDLDYLPHLKAIHFNNSKYPFSSRKDRHANLVSGHIKEEQLRELLTSSQLTNIPFIIETPKDEGTKHKTEIQWMKEEALS